MIRNGFPSHSDKTFWENDFRSTTLLKHWQKALYTNLFIFSLYISAWCMKPSTLVHVYKYQIITMFTYKPYKYVTNQIYIFYHSKCVFVSSLKKTDWPLKKLRRLKWSKVEVLMNETTWRTQAYIQQIYGIQHTEWSTQHTVQ